MTSQRMNRSLKSLEGKCVAYCLTYLSSEGKQQILHQFLKTTPETIEQ